MWNKKKWIYSLLVKTLWFWLYYYRRLSDEISGIKNDDDNDDDDVLRREKNWCADNGKQFCQRVVLKI